MGKLIRAARNYPTAKKLSTERLRSRLVGAGYDEDLLNMYDEYMLTPRPAVAARPEPSDEARSRQIALKELEL